MNMADPTPYRNSKLIPVSVHIFSILFLYSIIHFTNLSFAAPFPIGTIKVTVHSLNFINDNRSSSNQRFNIII